LDVDGDVTITNSELVLNFANTWTFKEDPSSSPILSIRPSDEVSTFSIVDFFTGKGDGSQTCAINLFGDGVTHNDVLGEFLQVGWGAGDGAYVIRTKKRDSGSQREIQIAADGSTDQLVLETLGDVSMANNLDVGGDITATSYNAGLVTLDASELYYGGGAYFDMRSATYFRFLDDLLMEISEQIRFRDTNAIMYSPGIGDLIIDVRDEVQIDTSLLDINASGQVAITTLTLNVDADADISGTLDVHDDVTVNGLLDIDDSIDSDTANTGSAGEPTYGISNRHIVSSFDTSSLQYSIEGFGRWTGSSDGSAGTLLGFNANAQQRGSGNLGELYGLQSNLTFNTGDTGNLTKGAAVKAALNFASDAAQGTITDAYGVYVTNPAWMSDNKITNTYGICIDPIEQPSSSGVRTNYGLCIGDVTSANTANYAIKTGAGAVDFGDTLDVAGVTTLQGITQPPVDGDTGDIVVQTGVNTLEIKTPTVDVPVVLSMYDAEPGRGSETNWCGGMLSLATAQPLDSAPTDLAVTKGIGKLLIIVNAGSDISGSITITGESIDRETGASTPADTDSITVDTLTTDTSDTDTNGNIRHAFTNAYISSKWFTGSVTLSTTDLTLTDVDVFHISFEQFNDQPNIVLDTFDANLYTLNVNAEFDAYLFSVHVTGSKATIERHADLNIGADGETAIVNKYWRLRRGNLNDAIDGTTDGVWVDVHYSNSPSYIEDVTLKLWATETRSLTLN
jgi:hypothetical protein